jgi:hypothetical protein
MRSLGAVPLEPRFLPVQRLMVGLLLGFRGGPVRNDGVVQ